MTPVTALPQFPWLSLLVGLPLAGALLCLLQRRGSDECRWLALATTAATLGVSLWLFVCCGGEAAAGCCTRISAWIPRFGIRYTLALDGISLLLVLLTAFLHLVAVLVAWPEQRRVPLFLALLLMHGERPAGGVSGRRPGALLPLLGGDAAADGLSDRHLGGERTAAARRSSFSCTPWPAAWRCWSP